MNVCVISSVIFLYFILEPYFIRGDSVGGCSNADKKYSEILQRISPLTGRKFQIEQNKYKYNVGICSDVNGELKNASVTQESPDGNTAVVLGRRNRTEIVVGSSWLLLTYGDGDNVTTPLCSGPGRAEIVITCCSVSEPKLELRDVADRHGGGNGTGCFFMFDLVVPPFPNCSVVEHSKTKDEGLSNGSVFCIIFLTTFGVYLAVGIFYRRLVKGAKGFEQIPHADFWRKLGNLQADGCDFACRRGDRREESWQRLTNNFNDSQDDRDDALLRP
ncbi:cation-dependent mannose-6-phosphate receptor [Anabrus simplex]|uniref:cation-dependent mannose-6-phosphate receptor n=1 Tax=Anabrus simplex TaxID=316456 RepID=UPI0035A3CE20